MDKKLLKHISEQKYEKLSESAIEVIQNFNRKSIHQFRVSYKELRAFLRMVSIGKKKGSKLNVSKKINHAYCLAGKIRGLQLQLQKMHKTVSYHNEDEQYAGMLKKEIEKNKSGLLDRLHKNNIPTNQKKTTKKLPMEFTASDLEKFAELMWARISICIQEIDVDQNMHMLRKNLKDLYYVHGIYSAINEDESTRILWKGIDQKYIKECIDALGNLQDSTVAIALLDRLPDRKNHSSDNIQLKRLKKKWLAYKISKRKLILNQVRTKLVRPQYPIMTFYHICFESKRGL